MKILMCLKSTFPPDIRVEKEARVLTQAGHDVFILSKAGLEICMFINCRYRPTLANVYCRYCVPT